MSSMASLVIGVGGNLGSDDQLVARFSSVAQALTSFGAVRASPVYRTAPWGGVEQAAFLNAALAIAEAPPEPLPVELMEVLLELERLAGRDRHTEARWGPRRLDLDVLWWGARRIDHDGPPALRVPHPRLLERRFALQPLADLVGEEIEVPGAPGTLRRYLDATAAQSLERTALAIALG
jgi:2-amino-4-hydroxy-6-hydroxymethyldihydropteridine diphosphokinase